MKNLKTLYILIGVLVAVLTVVIAVFVMNRFSPPPQPPTSPEIEYIKKKKDEITEKYDSIKGRAIDSSKSINDAIDILTGRQRDNNKR